MRRIGTNPEGPRPPGQLSYGLVGTIEAVPPGCVKVKGFACIKFGGVRTMIIDLPPTVPSFVRRFSLETVMVVGPGPNAAVRRWGGLLARRYHKNNSETKDFTTTHLGYDTDNGAFYYCA